MLSLYIAVNFAPCPCRADLLRAGGGPDSGTPTRSRQTLIGRLNVIHPATICPNLTNMPCQPHPTFATSSMALTAVGDVRDESSTASPTEQDRNTTSKCSVGLALAACFKYETEISFVFGLSRTAGLCHSSAHVGEVLVAMWGHGVQPPATRVPATLKTLSFHRHPCISFCFFPPVLLILWLSRYISTYLGYGCRLARNERAD